MSSARVRRVAELGQEWVEKDGIQAVLLLAARRGRIVLQEAFGRLTPDANSAPLPKDAIFAVASFSKVLVATALMTLVEEGRVGLNRPVSSYIPEFQGEGKDGVLVRHLLTHTSGLIDEQADEYAERNKGNLTISPAPDSLHPLLNEWLQLRYGCPLSNPPGQRMSYCELGFELVGEIIRRSSAMALDRFVHSRVFQPLGMSSSYFCRMDAPQDRRTTRANASGYVPGAWDLAIERERCVLASGTAISTALDLAAFGQMFLNRGAYGTVRVLSPASVQAMTRNQIPGVPALYRRGTSVFQETFPEATWGFGWSVHGTKTGSCGALYSAGSFEHWGASGCYLWVDPVYDLVGVYYGAWPPVTGRETPIDWARIWRNDLFADAITAAIVDA